MDIAEKKPKPVNQHRDLVTRFKDNYAEALGRALISETHTATEGWQKLYIDHRAAVRKARQGLAKSIQAIAELVEKGLADEVQEKEIGDLKKECAELREHEAVFMAQTIEPVRAPADECRKIISDYMQQAANDEARTPLVNSGLEDLMKVAVSSVDKVEWNVDRGQVAVKAALG